MIERTLTPKLLDLAQKFPVVSLMGPRQSGKTTLVRASFPHLPYVSLEEPDIRQFALTDPRGFLANYPRGVVLDEAQNTPQLFSYIQTIVDTQPEAKFILTGSANFLLMEQISQTLAGRSALLTLLPLSLTELASSGRLPATYEEAIFAGQYPRLYDRAIHPTDFYPSYIQTYVERDVRLLKNIADLNAFIRFVQLCAGRVGQLLNYTSLANDAGLSPNTAKGWLSLLEASYIVYVLRPYHQNFSKQVIKSPKLYFYDTGLACSLLGLKTAEQVATHYLKGALFENLVINEFAKRAWNEGERPSLYFWQDNRGHEIDCLMGEGNEMMAVEIKAGQTMNPHFFRHLRQWQGLTGWTADRCFVVYGGEQTWHTQDGRLVGWRDIV